MVDMSHLWEGLVGHSSLSSSVGRHRPPVPGRSRARPAGAPPLHLDHGLSFRREALPALGRFRPEAIVGGRVKKWGKSTANGDF